MQNDFGFEEPDYDLGRGEEGKPEYCAETFLASKQWGGWQPILLKIDAKRSKIIDWFCPQCLIPIYLANSGRMACSKCGLHVYEIPAPPKNSPINQDKKRYHYYRWSLDIFESDEANASRIPRSRGRTQTKY
jgi:ribosomal protein S27AE